MATTHFKWLILAAVTALAGCDLFPSWINVTVNFRDAKTIKPDDPVEFNGAVIGKVSGLTPISNGVTVALALETAKAAAVQANAQAAIAVEPPPAKIVISNPPESAPPVVDGGVLTALEPKTGFDAILGAISDVKQAVSQAAKDFGDYFKDANQEWADSKQKMNESLAAWQQDAQTTETEIRERYQKLVQEMEAIRGEAGEQSRQIFQDYDEIEKELLAKQQALREQGQAKAAEALQTFRDELKHNVDKLK
ncbi:hypothetical protein A1507_07170 [Methylomonas koyamae]|uniref:Mce/MlaD domain-containing protein n=1 Tax=Methylomonas koyamae TaxID=702114 RepID=A0A177NP45_9GAMM|nr:MlaD family protein [Methylomonas koyamae]OAI19334.1 hypothetical protein A1507_07170 [Methylomonas koyamae]